MEPAIVSVISQRLVARVNNCPVELHPLINVVHNVIGALTELKIDLGLRSRRLEIEREWIRLTDAPRPGEDLTRRQESQERSQDRGRELRLPFHQIILVAAKRRSGLMIHVVLDERHAILRTQRDK